MHLKVVFYSKVFRVKLNPRAKRIPSRCELELSTTFGGDKLKKLREGAGNNADKMNRVKEIQGR